jgi:hypothetical protein
VVYEGDGEAVAHCASCEYDLCVGCAAGMVALLECNAGHPLRVAYPQQLAAESRDYAAGGYRCDQCNALRTNTASRHCAACRYDLCSQCVQRRLGYPITPVVVAEPPVVRPPVPLAGVPPPIHHIAGRIAPPRPRPTPLHIEGDIAPVHAGEDAFASAEWRRVLRNAGITDAQLRVDAYRQLVFETVRGLMPQDRRPAVLTELPPLSSFPRSADSITAALRSAWTRLHGTAPPPITPVCTVR